MRKSRQETAQTRQAIIAAASDFIRHTGIAEASLSDMMAEAGLTHGGFYRHFRNKEHLVAEALAAAGEKTIESIGRRITKGGVSAAVDGYLSKSQRDSRAPMCPFAALGSEMARSGKETRAAATEFLEKLLVVLADPAPAGTEARGDAIVAFCTMVGALTLARAVGDSELASEILDRAKRHLHE